MRLLIVDDDNSLAKLTAELLQLVDRSAGHIESISIAGDLVTALLLLPENDAVLCDGSFPISPGSISHGDEWCQVRRAALVCGVPFILYSGCAQSIEEARLGGIAAIAKPATIENIYAVLAGLWIEARPVLASGHLVH